jgi:NADPH:quinone reductase-like Zn-dependent oxidoreductase
MRAVRFDSYGDRGVLYVTDVAIPEPAPGRVVVQVVAAGINPGEAGIRSGALHERFPATFPCGQGTDLAGVVSAVGADVTTFNVGDAVYGWSWERSSHAEYVSVPVTQLLVKPAGLGWLEAGSLNVAGATAWAAVEAVGLGEGDVVAVSGAAGGVGSVAVQLAALKRATVLAIASAPNHAWLSAKGATPVAYGDGLKGRIEGAAPHGVDAFIDLFGPEYVELAIELGVAPERIETIISFQKAAEVGARTEGSAEGSTLEVMAHLGDLIASGRLEYPIAARFPMEQVQDAFALLEQRHTHGKIVLVMDPERAGV